ncbi:hypothetical protein [Singulisphaera sp. PoT]|uniref:hypothetical protein n=1 Tax=Singulisphaera sp. PoT TaxID=3411797 RepID=UPI003BF53C3C
MFKAVVNYDGVDLFETRLAALDFQLADFTHLGARLQNIFIESNRDRSTQGVDRDDVEFAPLNWGQPLTPKEYRKRGGMGPPLLPRGEASREISDFAVEIQIGLFNLEVRGHWPNSPWMNYHVSGFTSRGGNSVPARNPAGLVPNALDDVFVAVQEFAALAVREAFNAR